LLHYSIRGVLINAIQRSQVVLPLFDSEYFAEKVVYL